MTPKTTKGLAEILKDYPEQSLEDWWSDASGKILNIFEGATNLSITKYCPHLDKLITIKTDPFECECEQCIKDMKRE